MTQSEVFERIHELETSPSKLAIALAIYLYGPMNLKSLAEFIGRAKSTLLTHIKSMVKLEYLELDDSRHSWGKFYKLSKLVATVFQEKYANFLTLQQFSPTPEILSKSPVELLEDAMMKYADSPVDPDTVFTELSLQNSLSYNMQQFIIATIREKTKFLQLSYLMQKLQPVIIEDMQTIRQLLDVYVDNFGTSVAKETYYNYVRHETEPWKFREYIINNLSTHHTKPLLRKIMDGDVIRSEEVLAFPLRDIINSSISLNIRTPKQLAQVSNLISEFTTNLTKLKQEFAQEDVSIPIITKQYIHIFTGELSSLNL